MDRWLGVDVGGRRKGFDVALIDDHRIVRLQGKRACNQVLELVESARPALVAIDSPRSCAPDGLSSRACERELNRLVCGIRWTPDRDRVCASPYYAWILEGLALYEALAERAVCAIEVFPTASWTRWLGPRGSRSRAAWSRSGVERLGIAGAPARTNQDQRDAIAAAVTARLHTRGMTAAIGEIVVPESD